MRVRFATVLAVIMTAGATVLSASPAAAHMRDIRIHCRHSSTPILCAIHRHRHAVWKLQDRLGVARTPYHRAAEKSHSLPFRQWVQHEWYLRRLHWKHRYAEALRTPYPSWFAADMVCISNHEEYGMDGPNTIAGYFGLISPPSGYIDPGPSIAATYGDSWLNVPLGVQLELSYALYQAYGWSPWSTAPGCGLY